MVVPEKKKRPKPKPTIDYPPVPTKKWIPPDKRPKPPKKPPAYVKPEGITQRLAISSLAKAWHQFRIYKTTAVLASNFSQTHKRFKLKSNGRQAACNCVVAIAFSKIYDMPVWHTNHLDRILQLGDDLYTDSLRVLAKPCKVDVHVLDVHRIFFFEETRIQMIIESKLHGNMFPTYRDPCAFPGMLRKFYQMYQSGVLYTQKRHFAVWSADGAYYVFDPTEHNEDGSKWTGITMRGYAVLLRFTNFDKMIDWISDNLDRKNNSKFNLYPTAILRMIKVNTEPPETLEDALPKLSTTSITSQTSIPDCVKKPKPVVEPTSADAPETESMVLAAENEEFSPDLQIPESESQTPEYLQEIQVLPKKEIPPARIPPERPYTAEVHYYKDLMPEMIGILRGGFHQGSQKLFGIQAGKQGPANPMAAMVLRRVAKAKEWVPKVVDDILYLGHKIYTEFRESVSEAEQGCKVTDLPKKIEHEDVVYEADVEEFTVVGQLATKKDDVLDLQPALVEFFSDNDGGILTGPVTVAVWLEDGYYYMLDPNERGETGLRILPPPKDVSRGSLTEPMMLTEEKREHGAACVMWFANLKDLADVYVNNLDLALRREPFYISRVQMNDYIPLPDPWHNFTGIPGNKWILRGTFSQNSKRFGPESRNTQCTANATMALAYCSIKPEALWTRDTVDQVTINGDNLYNSCVSYLRECNKYYDPMLLVDEIQRQFSVGEKEVKLEIDDCLVNGIVGAKSDHDVLNLRKGFEEFFKDNETGVLTARSISVAVWKKDGTYYYYDSHSRDEKGIVNNFGTSCVLRILNIPELARSVEANLGPGSQDLYNISRVAVQVWDQTADGKRRPPLHHFTDIDGSTAIMQASHHMGSPVWELNRNKQALPMCLMAMAMAKVYPAAEWTHEILDEVMKLGDKLYVQTMVEIEKHPELDPDEGGGENDEEEGNDDEENPSEEEPPSGPITVPVTMDNVLKNYKIGVNKFEVTPQDMREGAFENELREALENHFIPESGVAEEEDDHKEAILIAENMNLMLWVDHGLYFLFDPHPRDETGDIFGKDEWSQIAPEAEEEVLSDEEEDDYENEETGEDDIRRAADWDTDPSNLPPDAPEVVTAEITEEDFRQGSDMFDLIVNEMLGGVEEEEVEEEEELSEEELERRRLEALAAHQRWRLEREKYWADEADKNGRACVKFFADLDRLVEHIVENTPPTKREELRFTLYPLDVVNVPEQKDVFDPNVSERPDVYAGNWYNFREIEHGRWILRGTMTILHKMFPERNRGTQDIASCFTALAFAAMYSLTKYLSSTVNLILQYGDRLLTFTKRQRTRQLEEDPDLGLTREEIDEIIAKETYGIYDISRKFSIHDTQIDIAEIEVKVKGDINAIEHEEVLDVKRGLETYFETFPKYAILHAKDLWVAVWRSQKTFFMFDPNSRGPSGLKVPDDAACITRYLDLGVMADVFLKNLTHEGSNAFEIYMISIKTQPFERPRPAEPVDKMEVLSTSTYGPVSTGKWILRGTISQEHPKFNRGKDTNTAPIAIVALAMSLVHKCHGWSKPIVDEIVTTGDELYDLSVDTLGFDFNPWEHKMTPRLICNDFNLGLLKVNFELTDKDQRGIINIKNEPGVQNLRQGIERFFEENTHGLIQTETLLLPIWEDEDDELYYLFDSRPRGPNGLGDDEHGVACVLSLANAKVMFDHIMELIEDPELRMGEFIITPVDLIVGDAKTKKKVKTKHKTPPGEEPVCPERRTVKRRHHEHIEALRKKKEAKAKLMLGRAGYLELRDGISILRGMRSQASPHYTENSRNCQDIPNCLAAYVMSRLQPIDSWHHKHIDMILDVGEQLYIDSYITYSPVQDKMLGLKNVLRKFFMRDVRVHVGICKPQFNEPFLLSNLVIAFTNLFQQENFALLGACRKWVGVFFKAGYYYVFYPRDMDLTGNRVEPGAGWATVVKYDSINDFSSAILLNLVDSPNDPIENYTITTLFVKEVKKVQNIHKKVT